MNAVKSLVASKTFWLAVAQGILAVYAIFAAQYPEIAMIGWVGLAKSFIDIYLRINTTATITSVLPTSA